MAITHFTRTWNSDTNTYSAPELVTEHTGAVLSLFSRDYRAMSDVYTLATFALVWCFTNNRPQEVLVNANFECDQDGGKGVVDATDEVKALHAAWKKEQDHLEAKAELTRELERAEKLRNAPAKGKKMVVVSGRKVAKGTVGIVAFVHNNGGALLKDEAVWTDRNAPGTWVDARHLRAV